MLKRLLCPVLALAATHAMAAPFGVAGIGPLTCGDYLAKNEQDRTVYTFWLAGFITGENAAKHRSTALSADANAASAWVDDYCRTHALDLFSLAAYKLDEELDRRAKAR